MPRVIDDSKGPIGAIISSMLTEPQFQASHGLGWILADGRSTSITGSIYNVITGFTSVPDLRGMVLRGRNDGGSAQGTRADGKQNPDGLITLGIDQTHAFASHQHDIAHSHAGTTVSGSISNTDLSHSHSIFRSVGTPDGNSRISTVASGENPHGSDASDILRIGSAGLNHNHGFSLTAGGQTIGSTLDVATGSNETRMRNVTVNHFIRIN